MSWAQRLKRVFNIDIETCSACGGAVKVIACIEDPVVIKKILTHLNLSTPAVQAPLPNSRAPPQSALFNWPEEPRNFTRLPSLLLLTGARHGSGRPQDWIWMFNPENRQTSTT